MSLYDYTLDGMEVLPAKRLEDIAKMFSSGKLPPTALLRKEGSKAWLPIDTILQEASLHTASEPEKVDADQIEKIKASATVPENKPSPSLTPSSPKEEREEASAVSSPEEVTPPQPLKNSTSLESEETPSKRVDKPAETLKKRNLFSSISIPSGETPPAPTMGLSGSSSRSTKEKPSPLPQDTEKPPIPPKEKESDLSLIPSTPETESPSQSEAPSPYEPLPQAKKTKEPSIPETESPSQPKVPSPDEPLPQPKQTQPSNAPSSEIEILLGKLTTPIGKTPFTRHTTFKEVIHASSGLATSNVLEDYDEGESRGDEEFHTETETHLESNPIVEEQVRLNIPQFANREVPSLFDKGFILVKPESIERKVSFRNVLEAIPSKKIQPAKPQKNEIEKKRDLPFSNDEIKTESHAMNPKVPDPNTKENPADMPSTEIPPIHEPISAPTAPKPPIPPLPMNLNDPFEEEGDAPSPPMPVAETPKEEEKEISPQPLPTIPLTTEPLPTAVPPQPLRQPPNLSKEQNKELSTESIPKSEPLLPQVPAVHETSLPQAVPPTTTPATSNEEVDDDDPTPDFMIPEPMYLQETTLIPITKQQQEEVEVEPPDFSDKGPFIIPPHKPNYFVLGILSSVEIIEYPRLEGIDHFETAKKLKAAFDNGLQLKQIRISLGDASAGAYVAPSSFLYMKGALSDISDNESKNAWLIQGNGEVLLKPSFGRFLLTKLNKETITLEKGIFCASEQGVKLNQSEGASQINLSGSGWIVLLSPVPAQELVQCSLNNEMLSTAGNFTLFTKGEIQGSEKTIDGSPNPVKTYRGTGEVWIFPSISIYERLKK